ncbi:MAG TPA: chromosome segregation protein SMC [Acetobacteraceae bacterium]|nr:chromosome segregation protein SMC [Acetobacteraceae bacterium]
MPIAFSRLRIAGFKSFAEPVSLEILPGLTGIVGPNGCGKSNVVEALRWAMGESSARSLRGGEMDDVIFAGTATRPARNLAEVSLTLEGGGADAGAAAGSSQASFPPPFHDQPELQVSRRIERGGGSLFRVNGRELRARDVQTLFADLASGARASGMVSQGRVAALINARPEERRAVLEEAAGITGLHARRHEAELKLRAAEANLARAEDLRGQLEAQLAGLRRQARQAARYRNLSGHIRGAEAELLALQRARVEQARTAARAALHAAEMAVAEATAAAGHASARAAEAAAALPPLRSAEADARTGLERHRIGQEQLAEEERRARAALDAATAREKQIARDLGHAGQLAADAELAEQRLAGEETRLAEAERALPARLAEASAAAEAADQAARAAEAIAEQATTAAARLAAETQAAGQLLAQAEARARRAIGQLARLQDEHARAASQTVDPARLHAAGEAAGGAEQALIAARQRLESAEQARVASRAAAGVARDRLGRAEADQARLAAEAAALAEILAVKDGERWPPMVDALGVPSGLETALGAALGEELAAAADRDAARHWRELPALDPGPAPIGTTPLATMVQAPPALARALGGILLVEDDVAGDDGQAGLRPGQVLVSPAGAIWRWDGYTIRAGTPTAAAVRLQQRNRLAGLRERLAEADAGLIAMRAAHGEAQAAEHAAEEAERAARAARRDAEQHGERARGSLAALRLQAESAASRLAALDQQAEAAGPEAREAEAALAEAQSCRAALADPATARADADRARVALATARSEQAARRSAHEALAREAEATAGRRGAIAAERQDWAMRAGDAADRVADLTARAHEAEAEQQALAAAPAEIALRRAAALDALQEAESAHRRTADALAAAAAAADGADRSARGAEAALAAAREAAVRAQGQAESADQAWGVVAERILERLGANPALPEPPADLSAESEDRARKRLDKLQREREEMGPVNLRADMEAEEVEGRIRIIEAEREELTTAIAKLRGSIGHLNREGRERLAMVFEQVDRNFQALFARMFGGGRAHLALVGSDDPLAAGLEIYAQPPGKKLAALSLLSGGEQALTALSLVFAVFRCNPAPVCVLDEVDAPLDDANVERFCRLLEDMVRDTGTRFLVVTHHHLSMARMDRLYGVTMQERGVSRLLSVDLHQAAGMAEPPRIAAE